MNRQKIAARLLVLARELLAAPIVAARKAVELREIPGSMMERETRYMIDFQGKPWGQLYYNTRGYMAEKGIPVPASDGSGRPVGLNVGEKGLGVFKREIARANKEWSALG